MRGTPPGPWIKSLRRLRRVCRVVVVDEHRTSKLCCACHATLHAHQYVRVRNGEEKLVDVWDTKRLYEVLDGPDGPYTIFAPTNEGFVTSLTPFESTVEDFLTGGSDEAAHTGDHLKYHVVRGTVRAADLSPGLVLNSIMDNGAAFTIQESRYNAGQFYAVGNNTYYERGNRGKILEADIAVPGSENIVHIINQFLFTEDE
ncbi:hypothetical protein F751_4003 [Auxenochlorella protothecoides]|uniref:FAS1 domain-containing protein n=1 Tax=Auxenochlorella protothecoides TaxID=3075 RepID=A0A087SHW9_AUXPR|nr:hypothetical protein F751_4003 [Auxenochlorella protothecoides]KFM25323.1 hypothetical protein F751_4003 [Auxenochlorella protothecoides]